MLQNTFIRSLVIVLSVMMVNPLHATAGTMVLVNLSENPTKESLLLHQKLKLALKKEKIDAVDFKKFQKESRDGNLLFTQAENFFLEYNLNAAFQTIDEALLTFWGNPEADEQLFKSYLLKAQIQKEMGHLKDAENSITQAIFLYPQQKNLDEALYSPKFRTWYQNIYTRAPSGKPHFDQQKLITGITSIGEKLDINQIVFTELDATKPLASLTLTIIDLKTKTKFTHQFEQINLKKDVPNIANNIVRSLSKSAPIREHSEASLPNTPKTASVHKKKMSKGLLWGLIGVVVVGAGVGAALGLSGGSSSSSSGSTTEIVGSTSSE